jgi:nucleotide-binding universal stress UspA family protein
MKTKLLVPTDFTQEAHSAIQHAVKLATLISAEVILLNVVKDKEDINNANKALAKEEALAKSINENIVVKTIVRIGNIFDDIGDAASELDVSMIFMGTHGASGWQKITGSLIDLANASSLAKALFALLISSLSLTTLSKITSAEISVANFTAC